MRSDSDARPGVRRSSLIIVSMSAVMAALVFTSTIEPGLGWGGDSALYILHAQNLIEGRDYSDTGYVYNPEYPSLSPKIYPPGYPALLSLIYRAKGFDTLAMRRAGGLVLGATLLLFGWLLLRKMPVAWASAGVGLLGLNTMVWSSSQLSSDGLFLFFVVATLALSLLHSENEDRAKGLMLGALLGIAMGLAYATRTVGVVVVPAVLAGEFIHRGKLRGSALLAGGVFGLAFLGLQLWTGDVASYLDQARPTLGGFLRHSLQYAQEASALWDADGFDWARKIFSLMTIVFVGFGLKQELFSGRRFFTFEIFGLVYLVVVISWPAFQGFRFLLPVIPLYLLYGLVGLHALGARVPASRTGILRTGLGVLAVLIAVAYGRAGLAERAGPGQVPRVESPEVSTFFAGIRDVVSPGDTVVFVKPRIMSLMTGLPSVANHSPETDSDLMDFFEEYSVSYVAVGPPALMMDRTVWLRSYIGRHPQSFVSVFQLSGFELFEVVR